MLIQQTPDMHAALASLLDSVRSTATVKTLLFCHFCVPPPRTSIHISKDILYLAHVDNLISTLVSKNMLSLWILHLFMAHVHFPSRWSCHPVINVYVMEAWNYVMCYNHASNAETVVHMALLRICYCCVQHWWRHVSTILSAFKAHVQCPKNWRLWKCRSARVFVVVRWNCI